VTVGTRDRLFFLASSRINGTNNRVQVRYTFQVLCAGKSDTLKAYAAQTSGNTNIKYSGNYDSTNLTIPTTSGSLAISKSVSPLSLSMAGTVEYTLVISNTAGITTTVNRITDTLPINVSYDALLTGSGNTDAAIANYLTSQPSNGATGNLVWIGGSSSANYPHKSFVIGANQQIKLVYRANINANSGTFTTTGYAGNSKYRAGPATISVGVGSADIAATMSATTSVVAGGNIVYTIGMQNIGTTTPAVTMEFPLPADVNYQSIKAPSGWTCTVPAVNATGLITCTQATMTASSTASFTVTAKSNPGLYNQYSVQAAVTVKSSIQELNTTNNFATTSTAISGPVITATKDYTMVGIGSSAVYTYTVLLKNTGTVAASDVVYEDAPDPNNQLVAASVQTSKGTISNGNSGTGPVRIAIGTITPNSTVTIRYRVIPKSNLPRSVTLFRSQGVVTGTGFPMQRTDFPTTIQVGDMTIAPYVARPILKVMKDWRLDNDVNGNGYVEPGDTIRYTMEIMNIGNELACSTSITDTFDINTTLVAGSVTVQGNMGTCVIGATSHTGNQIIHGIPVATVI
jgi:uncharacterized repeat protein (TIGR01451 family)